MDDLVSPGKDPVLGYELLELFPTDCKKSMRWSERFIAYNPPTSSRSTTCSCARPSRKDMVYCSRKLAFWPHHREPLFNGILTGKYNNGIPAGSRLADSHFTWLQFEREITPERIEKVKKLTELAQELGGSMPQLAIAWLLRLPEMTSVILGASKAHQLKENLKAVELKKKLTPDVLQRIEEILDNIPCPPESSPDKPFFD